MSLSMLIYLAFLAGSLNMLGQVGLFIGAITGTALIVFTFVGIANTAENPGEHNDYPWFITKRLWWIFSPLFILMLLFAVVVPSKDTVMQIVTVEVGTQLLQSKDGQEISGQAIGITKDGLQLIQKYITDQLNKDSVSQKTN